MRSIREWLRVFFKRKKESRRHENWAALFRDSEALGSWIKRLEQTHTELQHQLGQERDVARERNQYYRRLVQDIIRAIEYCEMVTLSSQIVAQVKDSLAATLAEQGIERMEVQEGQSVLMFPPGFLEIRIATDPNKANEQIIGIISPGYVNSKGELIKPASVIVNRQKPVVAQMESRETVGAASHEAQERSTKNKEDRSDG